jgi:(p)ppGpp synthase/HD superfamily hydrolase
MRLYDVGWAFAAPVGHVSLRSKSGSRCALPNRGREPLRPRVYEALGSAKTAKHCVCARLPAPAVPAIQHTSRESNASSYAVVDVLWPVLQRACTHIESKDSLERIFQALRLCAELPGEESTISVRNAAFLARLGVDADTICAALVVALPRTLLRYPPLDGAVRAIVEDLDALRAIEQSALVDIGDLDEQNARRLREYILIALRDARAVLARLTQVLQDLQQKVESESPAYDQQALALLVLQVHVPLAYALGLGAVMWPLEDLSFRILFPLSYRACESWHAHIWEQADQLIQEACATLLASLQNDPELRRYRYEITGRAKNLFSTFKKMLRSGKRREDILDIVALRIVIDGIDESTDQHEVCMKVYKHVIKVWPELPGRFKNYCDQPKANGYRSLHTTLRHPQGLPLEVQIRSREMHVDAEFGLASHRLYKGLITANASKIREFSSFAETVRLENTHVLTDACSFQIDAAGEHLHMANAEVQ